MLSEKTPLPRFQAEQLALTAWLREPDARPMPADIEPRRLAIYRELFFNNVAGFVENGFPILQRLLPEALWQRLTQGFFADHRCHTPYFHEIAEEFVRYFNSLDWPELAAFPWARELVHFEWVELAADVAEVEASAADPTGDLIEGVPVVNPATWPLVYHWPVHRFADEDIPEATPPQPSCVLVFRDAEHDVHMREIAPLTARLLELLQSGQGSSGREVLRGLAAEAGFADIDGFVTAGSGMLAELREAGIICGTISCGLL